MQKVYHKLSKPIKLQQKIATRELLSPAI